MKGPFCNFRRVNYLSALITALLLLMTSERALAQQKRGASDFAPKAVNEKGNCITINTDLVSFTVTVTDRQGRHVAGLDQSAFAVYEDDVKQEITFFSDRDAPASVGVVFDLSSSMHGDKLLRAREALARFIQTGHTNDEYSLISFSDTAQQLLDKTRDSGALLSRFSGDKAFGGTALYDAVEMGVAALTSSRYSKRALIVISDGEDNKSRATLNQVKKRSLESGVTIYTILIGPLLPRSNGRVVMGELASSTGGKSYYPGNGEAMSENFEQIALELRRQYSIGFTPSRIINDGRLRRLKVMVTPPDESLRIVVRGRQGYYPVAASD